MRNVLIGLVSAAVLLGGLVFLASSHHAENIQIAGQGASDIEPGFTGTRQIGPWRLACVPQQKDATPLPLTLTPFGKRGPHNTAAEGFGRCRLFLAFHRKDDPKQAVALLVFRILKRSGNLTVIAVVPPRAKNAAALYLRAGNKAVQLRIANCNTRRCVAVTTIPHGGEAALFSSGERGLVILRGKDGPHRLLGFSLQDMQAGIDAMRRAEI